MGRKVDSSRVIQFVFSMTKRVPEVSMFSHEDTNFVFRTCQPTRIRILMGTCFGSWCSFRPLCKNFRSQVVRQSASSPMIISRAKVASIIPPCQVVYQRNQCVMFR